MFQQVQHRPARSAVMLLRMVDDEEFTRRQGGLDGDDADAAACEVLGDGEPGHHRDTKARHHSTFHAVGMVERHRSCRGKAMTVPPGGHLTPCVGSFFAQEPRLRLELAGLQRPRPYQHRARGRDDQQVVVRHTSRVQFTRWQSPGNDGHIQIIAGDAFGHHVQRSDFKTEIVALVFVSVFGEQGREQIEPRRRRRAQPDAAHGAPCHFLHPFMCPIDCAEDAARFLQQDLARHRERDPAGGAIQQLRAKLSLEERDLMRHGGLGEVAEGGRPGEVAKLGDRDERAELSQFHSCSLSEGFNHFIGRIGAKPATFVPMIFRQFLHTAPVGASYLFGCGGLAQGVVVDPVDDIAPYQLAGRETGMRIVHVIDTHIHADHVSGGLALAEAVGATYHVHESIDAPEDARLTDAQELSVGNVTIRVWHTPGHTPEHISLLVTDRARGIDPWFVLTGHTLMVGDMGRTELATSADTGAEALFTSAARLRALPDHVEVWPGAFAGSVCGRRLSGKPSSTIGFERRFNRAFATPDRNVFVALMLADIPPRPENADEIRAVNLRAVRAGSMAHKG